MESTILICAILGGVVIGAAGATIAWFGYALSLVPDDHKLPVD